jgi:hypothetical protein
MKKAGLSGWISGPSLVIYSYWQDEEESEEEKAAAKKS